MENNPKWKFPSNNGGNVSGLNETGITQFKAIPVQSVTKETLQDSLDAKKFENHPSIVKFDVFDVQRELVPDVDGLTEIFEQGAKYWNDHEESKEFFENGVNVLKKDKITIMSIRDYNTTGLSEINRNIKDGSSGGWLALVRSTGVTEKGPNSSGSFGIGKHAPFAASLVQTILYGSKNSEGEYGFQGVSKIASFKDSQGEISQGTGYFGIAKENDFKPILNTNQISKPFQRTEVGTDKFIVGLAISSKFDWEFEVLKEAISSFMLAIMENKLEIYIGDFLLNKKSIAEGIKKIQKHEPKNNLIEFYEALISENKKVSIGKFKTPNGDEEEIHLHLLVKEGFQRKVVLYRGTGMKIFVKGYFRTAIEFAGVLEVKGLILNSVLRKTEPPTHDKWDPNLYKKNIKYAKNLLKEINTWINNETKSLMDYSNVESLELKGLENLLPDISSKEGSIIDINQKQNKLKTRKIEKSKAENSKTRKKGLPGNTEKGVTLKETDKNDVGKSDRERKVKEKTKKALAKISRVIPYCVNEKEGLYVLRIWPSTDGNRTFSLKSVGEDNKSNQLEIITANLSNGHDVKFNEDEVGPLKFINKELVEVTVKVKSRNKLAIEVYAN